MTQAREPVRMGAATGERSGVLVIRAWVEGRPPQLKARITHTVDPAQREHDTATVASAEQIHEEIRRWLAALEGDER